MFEWHKILSQDILPAVEGDTFWQSYLREIIHDGLSSPGLHLAVFIEPYLQYILEGKKTIESRFGARKVTPYGQVAVGDVILLKRSSGPIVGVAQASDVWFYILDPTSFKQVRQEFSRALCAQDPEFWQTRKDASFATLIRLIHVRQLAPVDFPKRDRRGWVTLRSSFDESRSLFSWQTLS